MTIYLDPQCVEGLTMNSSTDAFKRKLCLQAPMIAPLSSPDVAEACLDVSTVLMVDTVTLMP